MLTVEQTLARLHEEAAPIDRVELISTLDADRRVLAADLVATIDVPPLDNSQMDGYAVRVQDIVSEPATLPISQRIAAGRVGHPLEAGTAARIFTGAPIPAGADAVVMQEACTDADGRVTVSQRPEEGAWIRRRGSDIRSGSTILKRGTALRPQDCGLAASVGVAHLSVFRRLRVATAFTGDELAMPGERLAPGRIYNSNRFVLRGLLERISCEVVDLGIVPDRLDATRAMLIDAAARADLIVTSGGVSVGEEDHVKAAVGSEGSLDLWQVAMKPGKPLAFGRVRGIPVIGLPGNPVSNFVTFLVFARPFIRRLQGIQGEASLTFDMRADFDWPRADKRREFLRVRRNADGGLELFGSQNSGVLTSTVWGDGLVDNPPATPIERGQRVRYMPFSDLLA